MGNERINVNAGPLSTEITAHRRNSESLTAGLGHTPGYGNLRLRSVNELADCLRAFHDVLGTFRAFVQKDVTYLESIRDQFMLTDAQMAARIGMSSCHAVSGGQGLAMHPRGDVGGGGRSGSSGSGWSGVPGGGGKDPHLSNACLTALRDSVEKLAKDVQVNYHNLFRSTSALINTPHYTGASASAFKSYLARVTVPVIAEVMELSEVLAIIARKIETDFQQLEAAAAGVVRQSRLEHVRSRLLNHQNVLEDYIAEVTKLNDRLRALGVTPGTLDRNTVIGSYRDSRREILNINVELNNIDRQNLAELGRISARITRLMTVLGAVGVAVFSGSSPNFSNLDGIPRNIAVGGMGVLDRMKYAYLGNANALLARSWATRHRNGQLEVGRWEFLFIENGRVGLYRGNSSIYMCDTWTRHASLNILNFAGSTHWNANVLHGGFAVGTCALGWSNSVTYRGENFSITGGPAGSLSASGGADFTPLSVTGPVSVHASVGAGIGAPITIETSDTSANFYLGVSRGVSFQQPNLGITNAELRDGYLIVTVCAGAGGSVASPVSADLSGTTDIRIPIGQR